MEVGAYLYAVTMEITILMKMLCCRWKSVSDRSAASRKTMSFSGPTQVLADCAGLFGGRLFKEKQFNRTAVIHRFTL